MAVDQVVDDLVRAAFRAGEPLDLRGTERGALPTVRAETLVWLLTEDPAARRAVPLAWLAGVRVLGELRLAGAQVSTPMWFNDCVFEQAPDLRMAGLETLTLAGCRLPGLRAANVRIAADLTMRDTVSTGTVVLNDAQIGGALRLSRAELRVPGGYALYGERMEVRALYGRRMRTEGEIRIPGARVTGNVNFGGAQLTNPGGDTLDANGLDVSGSLIADRLGRRGTQVSRNPRDRFVSNGRILLSGARIGGDLVLSGAQVYREMPRPDRAGEPDPGSPDPDLVEQSMRLVPRGIIDAAACFVADRIRVQGNLELDDGFSASGTVRLPNALVGGYLRFSGAELGRAESVPAGAPASTAVALLGDGMEIGGDLEARDDGAGPLRVTGQLRLTGAHVRGSASLSGIVLSAPGADALHAYGLRVGGTLYLRRVSCTGTVRLSGASIGGSLDCAYTQLTKPRLRPSGTATPSLDLRAATIGKDLFCNDGFLAEGGVRLRSSEVLKSVVVLDATLGADGVAAEFAFNGYGLVTPELTLLVRTPPTGRVQLSKARVGSWTDNAELWQAAGGLDVDGFEYQALAGEMSVADRLRWLRLALGPTKYRPGPYEQLAAAYRSEGLEYEAEQVLIARQRHRYATLGSAGRMWGELQRCTVGFGYRPWLAVAWLTLFWVLGAVWFATHPLSRIDTGQVPVWNPWLYAADTLIPLVNLGTKGYWRAEGASQWISSALVVVGWILATTAARGAARVLNGRQ
jgi:hypothetical protein